VKVAQAGLLAAQQQLAANRARVDGTTLEDHPQVRDAAAAVRNAYLTLARTELPAPVAGFVARRNVQLGQRVSPGTPLMAVVPLDQVWVDANFKEDQLARMRPGQHVTFFADVLPGRTFAGRLVSLAPATGAVFSVIPPENATGNFTKIVQRVPVRIAVDDNGGTLGLLRPGLSTTVSVYTRASAETKK
jgi:membrane fusion protein (multidrug efflux system)